MRAALVRAAGAQSYRPSGTAAEYTVVPADQAVALPEQVGDEVGACLGIRGITAHCAVFGDGPVCGSTVLVLGGVGSLPRSRPDGGAWVLGIAAARPTWTASTGRWLCTR
ncbi:MAG TPA: hypothetical protein VIG96_05175, partial [Blastococcus sp.]